jgi:hypothetical protein
MRDFFATLSIWTGAIVATLTIVDWLLTESQKKSMKGRAEYAWLWLDEQKMGRFISYLKSYKIQFLLSVITYILLNLLIVRYLLQPLYISLPSIKFVEVILISALMLLVTVALISWIIHSRIVLWIVNADTLNEFFFRSIYVWLIGFGATFSLVLIKIQFDDSKIQSLLLWIPFFALYLSISAETGLIFLMLLLSVLWYCHILLVMILFRTTQFTLFRIIENPRGPVLGISGFLVGIGALVKVFF